MELNENASIMSESTLPLDTRLINIKSDKNKRFICFDLIKIFIICLFSIVCLFANYIVDQNSISNISNIYKHMYFINYRPICVRYHLLFLLNQMYDGNDCNCPEMLHYYQSQFQDNEEIIFETELPWIKLQNYYADFQKINYHDLCTGIFEVLSEYNEIIGIFLDFK